MGKLQFEREMILINIKDNAISFRSAIDALRKNRHEILVDVKQAELKLITLFQEYKLLQTFETRDIALQNKRVKCKKDKGEITANITEFQTTLDTKLEVQRDWQSKLSNVASEFSQLVLETNQYWGTLSKIFKKKVKLQKMREDGEDEDDDDEEEIEDICPPGCDKLLYEKVIELRATRVENEAQLNEVSKAVEELKKNIDRQRGKEKQID